MTRFFCITTLLVTPAFADHGRDFLFLQDVEVPSTGEWIMSSNFNFSSQSGPDEAGAEVELTTGIFPRTSFAAVLQYADLDGAGWDWSAAGASIQFDLTPPGSPVLLGLSLGRDFSLAGEGHHHDEHEEEFQALHGGLHDDDGDHDDHDDDDDHDDADEHEHSGIHQHGIDDFRVRLTAEGNLPGGIRVVGNLIGLLPDDGDAAMGYAIGVRHQINHHLGLGLEATGDFNANEYQEAAVGIYYSPVHSVTVKFGVGTGLNETSPNLTLRTGVVWKF